MAMARKILLNHNLKRGISSTMVNLSKNTNLQGRFMRKLMRRDVGRKKWYENKQRLPSSPIVNPKLTSSHVSRRRTVLNKLFMKHITDLMATGEASTEILGRCIEITHVNITSDFRMVLVYWTSRKNVPQEQTQEILNDCAYRLRHELTQLRVIGQVPMIQFVKNKHLAFLAELETRFGTADYGEDYVPTMGRPAQRPTPTLSVKLPEDVRKKILDLEDKIEDEEEVDDDWLNDIPPMRHDVLGLNHHAIMSRVKLSLNKSHEAARQRLLNLPSESPPEPSISSAVQGFLTGKDESAAFMEFLRKRQLEEKRIQRIENRQRMMEYKNLTGRTVEEDSENHDDEVFMLDENDTDEFEDLDLESLKQFASSDSSSGSL